MDLEKLKLLDESLPGGGKAAVIGAVAAVNRSKPARRSAVLHDQFRALPENDLTAPAALPNGQYCSVSVAGGSRGFGDNLPHLPYDGEAATGLTVEQDEYARYAVKKMKYAGKAGAWDKTRVIYNSHITLEGIPEEAHRYMLGSPFGPGLDSGALPGQNRQDRGAQPGD